MKKFNAVLLASAGLVSLASAASAAAPNWTGGTSSWFTATNWSAATVPAAGDIVTVGNGGTSQIDGARATAALASLAINGGSTVDLQTRGTLTATAITVGNGTTAGTLLMSGSNAVTGAIALNNGTLTSNVSFGAISNTIALNGNATASTTVAGNGFSLSGLVSGTGGLTVAGAGQVTLLANDTYSGGTTINSGATLSLGQGTAAGSIVGNVTDNGTLALNRNAAFTFGGVVSGTGALTSIGTNTLTAADTYSGLTQISTGTLLLSGAGSVANSSVISFSGAHNASLDISGITAATTSVKGLQTCVACTGTDTTQIAGGTINLGAKNLTITGSPTAAYLGAITGTGSLTVSGSQTLTGTNTYTGGTTLNSGAILTIGLGAGTTGSIVGNVLDNGNLTFHRSDAVTFAGVISGSGVVSVFGAGTVTLTGVNTVTGRITTNPGTLALSGNGSIASAALRNFGVFDISQTNAGATVQTLELTPIGTNPFNGALFLGSKTLTIANAINEYDGVIKDGGIAGGTGGGVTLLAGTETFAGANTYTGATTITGGTLVLTSAGSIANSAVTVQNGGTLSGTGASGATTVQSGGILTPGGAGTVGTMTVTNLTLNSGAIVNADVSATTADKITDSGAASINGILNASFATTGTYAVTQYTLISATGALSGTFANFNVANLPANFVSSLSYDAHDVFLNLSALSSTGTANVDGGTTTISGNQTTGGLSSTGSGGTVAITSGSTLTDNQNTNTTFSGTITGAGAVVKTGTGTLILDGVNTYTGGTGINGGILEVGDTTHPGAAIQGPVTVGTGGTLQGHGTINGAVTIGAGGNLQPGGTIGTITVGSASFASGSTYTVETSNTQADLLKATGAVNINSGAKLVVTEDGAVSSYARTTTYSIVQAGGGLSGSFGSVASTSASFLPTVTYTANGATVTLLRTDLAAALATGTNQANVATALFAGGASALSSPLAAMSDAGVQAAYGQLAGDIHASLRSAAVEDSRIVRDAVLDHLNANTTGTGVWAVGFGGYGSIATNGNAASLHHNDAGFLAGADMDVGSGFRLGLGGAYTSNNASTSGHASTASGDMGHILGYAGWSDGTAELKLGGDYGWGNVNVSRNVSAYGQVDSGRQDQQVGQVFGEFGTRIDGTPIHPYVDLASISATTGAFAEGGGSAALSGGSKTDTQTYSTVGLRLAMEDWGGFIPRIDVGWQHAFNSFAPGQQQTLQAVSQTFTVLGAPLARDAAALRAGFGFAISPDATLSLDYDGSVAGGVQNNAIRGGLDWKF